MSGNTGTPLCTACQAGAIRTDATHRVSTFGVRPDHAPEYACDFHSRPGDERLPPPGAVDQARKNVWPELEDCQGMD